MTDIEKRLKRIIQKRRVKTVEGRISSIISVIGIEHKCMTDQEADDMLDALNKLQTLLQIEKAVLESI